MYPYPLWYGLSCLVHVIVTRTITDSWVWSILNSNCCNLPWTYTIFDNNCSRGTSCSLSRDFYWEIGFWNTDVSLPSSNIGVKKLNSRTERQQIKLQKAASVEHLKITDFYPIIQKISYIAETNFHLKESLRIITEKYCNVLTKQRVLLRRLHDCGPWYRGIPHLYTGDGRMYYRSACIPTESNSVVNDHATSPVFCYIRR